MLATQIELAGLDGFDGALYCGTGCFHRRESICGGKYSKNHRGELSSILCNKMKDKTVHELEKESKVLANCSYEKDTQWGKEVSLSHTHARFYVEMGLDYFEIVWPYLVLSVQY